MMAFTNFDGYSQYTVQLKSINEDWKSLNKDVKTSEVGQTATEVK